jgi:hypothetical protein
VAGYIYLPVVTEETIYIAEQFNQGRIEKLVGGQSVTVDEDPTLIYDDEDGCDSLYITFGSSEAGAYIRVEGQHEDFVKLSWSGLTARVEGGTVKKVWAKSDHPDVSAELEFGVCREPYTVLAAKWTGTRKWLRRIVGLRVLRNVTAADRLYVIAHGYVHPETGAAGKIGAARGATRVPALAPTWEGGTNKMYTATQLAKNLKAEGLPGDFQSLYLFACGTGLDWSENVRSYAYRLKEALRGDFPHIIVYGYKGDVVPNAEYRNLPKKGSQERQNYRKNPSKGLKGMTATKHRGVKVGDKKYPAKSMRVMF